MFDTNLRHFLHPGEPAFCKPGFESSEFPLEYHHLETLLDKEDREVIDARPRIVSAPSDALTPTTRLIDLEHVRMAQMMLPPKPPPEKPLNRYVRQAKSTTSSTLNATSWWNLAEADALLTYVLPQHQPFRRNDIKQVDLVLLPDEDAADHELHQFLNSPQATQPTYIVEKLRDQRISPVQVTGRGIGPWGATEYIPALIDLAQEMDIVIRTCAWRFGTVTLPESDTGWRFHPALGFSKWSP